MSDPEPTFCGPCGEYTVVDGVAVLNAPAQTTTTTTTPALVTAPAEVLGVVQQRPTLAFTGGPTDMLGATGLIMVAVGLALVRRVRT